VPSPSPGRTERRPDAPLVPAWLLLSLSDGESYGRALFARLSELGIDVESNHGYRMLRALDSDRAIASRWTTSTAGPRRRSYRLTRAGRATLDGLAARIAASLRLQESFLRARGSDAVAPAASGGGQPAAARRAATPADAPAVTVGPQLLAAWLLLLVQPGPAYGYGLRRALGEHRVPADPAAVYRALRTLERDGRLRSSWTPSATGPPRRLYRLTDAGRRRLDELSVAIAASRDTYAAFLDAYGRAGNRPPPR
jgi:PadR family transcriptional regulator PadR